MIKNLTVLVLCLCAYCTVYGQTDPVLFTVGNTPVTVSEFKYIYGKTNGEKADYSRKSLDEYLELYTKFKLKVQRARDMQLDTASQLRQELDTYRRQLSDSYLIDREVTDRLIREVYERSKEDVSTAHIFISCAKTASPADTIQAYNKMTDAWNRLEKGESFAAVCNSVSEDKASKENGGALNYLTALLPDGFYNLENAMYNTPIGKYSKPIRTSAGYHIVAVSSKRPARGEIEVSHILFRDSKEKPNPLAKMRIDSVYQALLLGAKFDDLANNLSEDNTSNKKAGYIGFFGINRYEKNFEEAAFGIAADGQYSQPFQTGAGWHIIKRISVKSIDPFDTAKNRLKSRVQRDGRHELAKQSMIERIRTEAGFKENVAELDKIVASLDTNFLTFRWKSPEKVKTMLFNIGSKEFSVGEFTEYMFLNSRKRMESGNTAEVKDVINRMYRDFINDSCLRYEETQLEKKYPDFKSLMREYEEGILLFEATKNQVWDKASQDSIGLQKYYDEYKIKYMWDDRAVVNFYALQDTAKEKIEKLRKYAVKKNSAAVLKKFNKDMTVVSNREEIIEKGKNKVLDMMEWKAGSLSGVETNKKDNSLNFIKVEKIIPRSQKELKEARGYVVADYQDYLEKQWVDDLKRMYKVNVEKGVFETLIK